MKHAQSRHAAGAHQFIRAGTLIPAALGLLVLTTFLPSLNNDFVNWDDRQNLQDNPHYRGLGPSQIRWAFTTFHMGVYQPLGWMSFGITYLLFGTDRRGYFLVNIVLHGASTITFYFVALELLRLARRVGPDDPRHGLRASAGLAAGVFAIHPLRVEAVSWATDQPYVLAGTFFLLSIWVYLRAISRTRSGGGWLGGSLVLFALSLLSKAIGVSLPVVLLVLDFYPLRRLTRTTPASATVGRALLEKLPFVVLSAAAAVVAAYASASYAGGRAPLGPPDRAAVTAYGLVFYLAKTVVPVRLSAFYPFPPALELRGAPFLVAAAVVLLATAGLLAARRRWPAGLAAWACYVAILLPVVGLVRHASHVTADRYAYLSCLPWALLLGAGFGMHTQARLRRGVRLVLATSAGAALVALATLTWRQQRFWRDSIALWTHVLEVTPQSPVSLTNLGAALAEAGRLEEAVERYEAALRLDSHYLEAATDLGIALSRLGRFEEAEQRLRAALRQRPEDAGLHTNLGIALAAMGRHKAALAAYRTGLRLDPDHVGARYNLALELSRLGELDAAADQYLALLDLRPDHAQARNNLGNILLRQGRYDRAVLQFELAARAEPKNPTPHINLGAVLAETGKYRQAVARYRRALDLAPDNLAALDRLAWLLATCPDAGVRNGPEAVRLAERACTVGGESNPHLLKTLAAALAEAGRRQAALHTLDRAVELARSDGLTDLVNELLSIRGAFVARPAAPAQ